MSVDDTEFRYLATFDTILFTKGGFGIKSAQKSFSFFSAGDPAEGFTTLPGPYRPLNPAHSPSPQCIRRLDRHK